MAVHDLKTLPNYFKAVETGKKNFEVRSTSDGTFKVGDRVHLHEFEANKQQYTGKMLSRRITYVLSEFEGLAPGYVCFGIEPI